MPENDDANETVLRREQNIERVRLEVMFIENLFHMVATATGNALSPNVDRRVRGTTRRAASAYRRRRSAGNPCNARHQMRGRRNVEGASNQRRNLIQSYRCAKHNQWKHITALVTRSKHRDCGLNGRMLSERTVDATKLSHRQASQ